jgi:hypothetical protein
MHSDCVIYQAYQAPIISRMNCERDIIVWPLLMEPTELTPESGSLSISLNHGNYCEAVWCMNKQVQDMTYLLTSRTPFVCCHSVVSLCLLC